MKIVILRDIYKSSFRIFQPLLARLASKFLWKYDEKQKDANISVCVLIYAEFEADLDSAGKVAKNTNGQKLQNLELLPTVCTKR
jgi:hypothetical protein